MENQNEIFTLTKGNIIYFLGNRGNIKDKEGIFTFYKTPVDYDYTTTIYKIPNPRDQNKCMMKYTIPLINSNPCKIYIGFHKIIDIIKFRKTEEE